jgi:CRISPR-associated protein Csx17
MTHDIVLSGCQPSALAGYLKALGVHRLVAEQADPHALLSWNSTSVPSLRSVFDAQALITFFVEGYAPTPLVSPWNGGSGFFAQDQQSGINAIEASAAPRFAPYREVIGKCRSTLTQLKLSDKPAKEVKPQLLERLRAELPDVALAWLDASCILGDHLRYPPLLGTGGNDGHLEFANNFMQRLAELLLRERPLVAVLPALRAALFGEPVAGTNAAVRIGQFAPGKAGGTNMTTGPHADGRANPWDFILMLEGALLFAGAASRRLELGWRGSASYPFHVNTSVVGYGASAEGDASSARAEVWLPLWTAPATVGEIKALFAEGRLELLGRRARTGLDAVRALAALGVDRGLDRFRRIGFLRRNGLAYLATPLGAFDVRRLPRVDWLREIDPVLSDLARLDRPGPGVSTARRRLESAMFEAARIDRPLTEVLAAVGHLERVMARSPKAQKSVRPTRRLSDEWMVLADDGSPEFQIAAAVASWNIRGLLTPVDELGRWTDAHPVWAERSAMQNLVALARHRINRAESGVLPIGGRPAISARALTALIDGRVDEDRLGDLLFGLVLVAPRAAVVVGEADEVDSVPPWFGILRAVCSPRVLAVEGRHPSPPDVAQVLARLEAHDLGGALSIAMRRLKGSGRNPRAVLRPPNLRYPFSAIAAALVVPLPHLLEDRLTNRALQPIRPVGVRNEEVASA